MAKSVLLIIGMHRSGTSLIAQMMAKAGFHLGSPLLDAPQSDNLQGHWEHAQVVRIHDELLVSLGRQWWSDIPLPDNWLHLPATKTAKKALKQIIIRETISDNTWVIKDPRLCRLMPLWLEIIDELQFHLKTILCLRHPMEVAKSLQKRDGMKIPLALRIWSIHQQDFFSSLPEGPDVTVIYDDIMENPSKAFSDMLKHLKLECSPDNIENASQIANHALRHQRTENNDPIIQKTNFPMEKGAFTIYDILCKRDITPSERARKVIEFIPLTYYHHDNFLLPFRAFWQALVLKGSLRIAVGLAHRHWRILFRKKFNREND